MTTQGDIQRAVDALRRGQTKPRDQWLWGTATVGGKRVRCMLLGRSLVADAEVSGDTLDVVLDGDSDPTTVPVLRPIAEPRSHVRALFDAAQSVPNETETTIIYNNELRDTLGEYNPSTGVFVAGRAGYYDVSATLRSASGAFSAGRSAYLGISNGTITRWGRGYTTQAAITERWHLDVRRSIYLSAGQSLSIRCWHNIGATVGLNTDGQYCWLTIDRLP